MKAIISIVALVMAFTCVLSAHELRGGPVVSPCLIFRHICLYHLSLSKTYKLTIHVRLVLLISITRLLPLTSSSLLRPCPMS